MKQVKQLGWITLENQYHWLFPKLKKFINLQDRPFKLNLKTKLGIFIPFIIGSSQLNTICLIIIFH